MKEQQGSVTTREAVKRWRRRDPDATPTEIACAVGVTRERVRQILVTEGMPTRTSRSPHRNGITNDGNGYVWIRCPNHPNVNLHGYVREHMLKAASVLGGRVPDGVQVHHVNGNRSDNRNNNLVVCQDAAYHQLLHRRARALAACGNANGCKCNKCGEYDDPSLLKQYSNGTRVHRTCVAYERKRKRPYGTIEGTT